MGFILKYTRSELFMWTEKWENKTYYSISLLIFMALINNA